MEALLEVAEMFQQRAGALRAAILEDAGPLLEANVPVQVVGDADE